MAKDPKKVAEKWARNLSASTEYIRSGVEATTTNPAQEAIKKKAKLKARWNEAIDSGKWESALGKITTEDWKRAMIDKGLARIGAGATASQPKMEAFLSRLLPYIDSVKAKIATMPDVTLEDRINRMTTFIREMAKFKKTA
jgi:predicted transcriptional regulator